VADKELWREMFDVSPDEAEKAIRGAVKMTEGAKLLNFEKRPEPSELFRQSNDVGAYNLTVDRKLFADGKSNFDPDEEIPF
jgi:hypothetical protein